jgi:hypothetical protein
MSVSGTEGVESYRFGDICWSTGINLGRYSKGFKTDDVDRVSGVGQENDLDSQRAGKVVSDN